MSVIEFEEDPISVYIIMGIDEHEHDQVIAVCKTYDDAKQYCIQYLMETEFYDLWIEKHLVM